MTDQPAKLMDPRTKRLDDDKRTVRLFFPEGSAAPSGEYWLRGGICWPVPTPPAGVSGYAVLCGYHMASEVVYIFREHEFVSIDPLKRLIGGEEGASPSPT